MLTWVLGGLLLVAWLGPETVVGRGVRRLLVDLPALVLTDLTPRRVLTFVALCVAVIAFAQVMPGEFLLVAAGDAVTYLEIVVAAWLVSTGVRIGRIGEFLAAQARRLARVVSPVPARLAQRSSRRARRPARRSPRGDDAEERGVAFA